MASDAKQNLLYAGTRLFAEHGFAGASVRDICAEAGVGRNMIHHYFGNKDGLLQAILDAFSTSSFAPAIRLLAKPAGSVEEFRLKLELFIAEVFEVLISNAQIFRIVSREAGSLLPLTELRDSLVTYLCAAKDAGFIAADLDETMAPGFILDRLGGQVLYALRLGDEQKATVILDPAYRAEWLTANSRLLLFGLAAKD